MPIRSVDELMGGAVLLIILLTLLSIALILFLFWIGWWWVARRSSYCPYTRVQLVPATLISYEAVELIYEFMQHLNAEENPAFELSSATVCRKTGRIFPASIGAGGRRAVAWNFLSQRYPGQWISWGSLSPVEQERLRSRHTTLKGFQTEASSPDPRPSACQLPYSLSQPGPLYVDMASGNLLGWKQVPGCQFELLVVQKPKRK